MPLSPVLVEGTSEVATRSSSCSEREGDAVHVTVRSAEPKPAPLASSIHHQPRSPPSLCRLSLSISTIGTWFSPAQNSQNNEDKTRQDRHTASSQSVPSCMLPMLRPNRVSQAVTCMPPRLTANIWRKCCSAERFNLLMPRHAPTRRHLTSHDRFKHPSQIDSNSSQRHASAPVGRAAHQPGRFHSR